MSLMELPSMIPIVKNEFPADVIERAKHYINLLELPGTGAYTRSQGLCFVLEDVARFITARDNLCDPSVRSRDPHAYSLPDNIFLGDGSSCLIRRVLQLLINGPSSGIMIPVPQYPLYSATISLLGGSQIPYYLDESNNWSLDMNELEKAYFDASANDVSVKGLVVINPGNPTGQVLTQTNMENIIQFCKLKDLVLIADEVYQENIYDPVRKPFISFKKVKHLMGTPYQDVKLFSSNSASKGFVGECGRRAGYIEMDGIPDIARQEYIKLCSIELCPNTMGQILVGLMARPPVEGEESFKQYERERDEILNSLSVRANIIISRLRSLEGVTCTKPEGAMYVFPSLTIPARAIQKAEECNIPPDTLYCQELLEQTGICAVPGSGFKQVPGTHHLRMTFLPPKEKMLYILDNLLTQFHRRFMEKYS
ncbi:probable alanine aminotransferase, mitochondrial isoform X2 [Schistocerca gregaria]|nr:probable alanine aminotransferase, mitochondrial isoform X2 [Schistocerca gregaria]